MLIKFNIPQWIVDNVRTKTMVTLCQKTAGHVLILSSDEYKNSALGAVNYCRLRVYYFSKTQFPPSCKVRRCSVNWRFYKGGKGFYFLRLLRADNGQTLGSVFIDSNPVNSVRHVINQRK